MFSLPGAPRAAVWKAEKDMQASSMKAVKGTQVSFLKITTLQQIVLIATGHQSSDHEDNSKYTKANMNQAISIALF